MKKFSVKLFIIYYEIIGGYCFSQSQNEIKSVDIIIIIIIITKQLSSKTVGEQQFFDPSIHPDLLTETQCLLSASVQQL